MGVLEVVIPALMLLFLAGALVLEVKHRQSMDEAGSTVLTPLSGKEGSISGKEPCVWPKCRNKNNYYVPTSTREEVMSPWQVLGCRE